MKTNWVLRGIQVSVFFAWFDFWCGAYYDVGHRTLYICPLPMLVLRLEFPGEKNPLLHRPDRTGDIPDEG